MVVGDGVLRGPPMSLRPSGSLTVAFALTFMVVGIVWANHLLAFAHFVRTDHVLVSLNLLELMSIAFLSVPTHLFLGKTSAIAAIHSMYIRRSPRE